MVRLHQKYDADITCTGWPFPIASFVPYTQNRSSGSRSAIPVPGTVSIPGLVGYHISYKIRRIRGHPQPAPHLKLKLAVSYISLVKFDHIFSFFFLQIIGVEGRGSKKSNTKWVRTRVEVDKHIVVPDLSNLKIASPDRFLEDYISDLSTTSLDRTRPLWEFHVLNLRTSEAESVAIFRCHHSLGDGVSLMSLLMACSRKNSDPNSLPTIPEKKIPTDHNNNENHHRCVKDLLGIFVRFMLFTTMIWNTVVDLFWFTATSSSWLKDTMTPISGKEGVQFKKKRFVHTTLLMEDVKCVKRAANGVIFAIYPLLFRYC